MHYQEFMEFTGVTDRDRGRLYKCPRCGKKYWSCWGQARRHFERELKEIIQITKDRDSREVQNTLWQKFTTLLTLEEIQKLRTQNRDIEHE